jgi:putative ABC transport system permease protein
MLFKTSLRIIVHEKEKFSGAVAGVALATFLMILQCGFYLGYDRDITVVLDSVDADLWIIPRNQPLFDGWDAMDDLPYYRLRERPEIAKVARLVWGYAPFRLPAAGGRDTVEVLGVELDSGIGLKLDLGLDDPAAELAPDGHILVARKDCEKLGITELGGEGIEIRGRKATVIGLVEEVHLFTTAGFVMTDLDNARAFMRLPDDHASYIVAKCEPDVDVATLVRSLQAEFPEHDVMATPTYHDKASRYWSTRTGIGPVLMLSAGLAILVGFMIVMLAFYISTVDKLPVFACMKALGASGLEVVLILVFQVMIVFVLGCALAALGLQAATVLLSRTTISVVITRELVLAGLATTALCSAASALLSIRQVIHTDPGEAFRT